jgi:hypothetical protein
MGMLDKFVKVRARGKNNYLSELTAAIASTSIYLSIYGSTALVDLGRFFSFLIYTQSTGLLGRGISRRKAATYIQNNTNIE